MRATTTVSTIAITAGVRKARSACAQRSDSNTRKQSAHFRMLFHDLFSDDVGVCLQRRNLICRSRVTGRVAAKRKQLLASEQSSEMLRPDLKHVAQSRLDARNDSAASGLSF
jgi:hypothetical protein